MPFHSRGCKSGEGEYQYLTRHGREILETVKCQTQRLVNTRQFGATRVPSIESVPCTRSSENDTIESLTSGASFNDSESRDRSVSYSSHHSWRAAIISLYLRDDIKLQSVQKTWLHGTLQFAVILTLFLEVFINSWNKLYLLCFKKCLTLIVREMSTETEFFRMFWLVKTFPLNYTGLLEG